VADIFALGKADRIVAQPTSTYSVVSAWIANKPFSEMTGEYSAQPGVCKDVPAGMWGKTTGLHYPVKCWLPLADGVDPATVAAQVQKEDAPTSQEVSPLAESNTQKQESAPQQALCASKGGVLSVSNPAKGICCPAECGERCGGAGCGAGGTSAACCAGAIRNSAVSCAAQPDKLTDTGCIASKEDAAKVIVSESDSEKAETPVGIALSASTAAAAPVANAPIVEAPTTAAVAASNLRR
jgi:hypothetical protein